jgi:ABC-type phosphonate transport system ATPase subunit
MAGSGKTTLVQAMNAHMAAKQSAGYLINLDPAVRQLPYEPNIDIRDTVRTATGSSMRRPRCCLLLGAAPACLAPCDAALAVP